MIDETTKERIKTLKEIYSMNKGNKMGASKLQRILGFKFPPEGTPEMQKLFVLAGLSENIKVSKENHRTMIRVN